MPEITLESRAASETEHVGELIAGTIAPGDLVLVSGELGTGKTTLVRGACRALGIAEPVTSPTFVIGHLYDGDPPVSHVDLYRLDGLGAEDPALLSDYINPQSIAFVEWPERGAARLGIETVTARVRLEHAGHDRRKLTVSAGRDLICVLEADARR